MSPLSLPLVVPLSGNTVVTPMLSGPQSDMTSLLCLHKVT